MRRPGRAVIGMGCGSRIAVDQHNQGHGGSQAMPAYASTMSITRPCICTRLLNLNSARLGRHKVRPEMRTSELRFACLGIWSGVPFILGQKIVGAKEASLHTIGVGVGVGLWWKAVLPSHIRAKQHLPLVSLPTRVLVSHHHRYYSADRPTESESDELNILRR